MKNNSTISVLIGLILAAVFMVQSLDMENHICADNETIELFDLDNENDDESAEDELMINNPVERYLEVSEGPEHIGYIQTFKLSTHRRIPSPPPELA